MEPKSEPLNASRSAITQGSVGAIDENEIWRLGPIVLGLLDALIERRISS